MSGVTHLLRQSITIFVNEFRLQYRDGHVLISSLLFPLLLYPVIFWLASEMTLVGQGSLEKLRPRIGVEEAVSGAQLVRRLSAEREVAIYPVRDGEAALTNGDIDALLQFEPRDENTERVEPPTILYDESRPRSRHAQGELQSWLDEVRRGAVEAAVIEQGGTRAAVVVFGYDTEDVATPTQISGFFLGFVLPITMVGMTCMGAFYPAIDVLVGERERKTLETIMTSGADRLAVVIGKYLAVVAAAMIAASLNLGSMLLTAFQFFRSHLADSGMSVSVPGLAVPVLLLGSLLLAGLVGAVLILLCSLGRSFREGQGLAAPFYMIAIVPAMVANTQGMRLSINTATIPIMNLALMMRGSLQGTLEPAPFLVTVIWTLILIGLLLWFASWLFRQEEVMIGHVHGSLLRYVGQKLKGRSA